MSTVIIPPMPPIHKDATLAERQAAFVDYSIEIHRLNPGRFLPRGVNRRWWHFKL